MGRYLQAQYEERDLAKALAKIHGFISDDTKKLSDKVKKLELSHNRMRTLLKMTLQYLEDEDFAYAEYLHKRITLELYGLEGYQGLKGGKRCV